MLLIAMGIRIPLYRLSVRLAQQKDQLATLDATLEIIKKAQADHTGSVSYTIHTPQQGCPAGWGLAVGIFTEKDGSHEDGCVHGQGPTGEVDVLKTRGVGQG